MKKIYFKLNEDYSLCIEKKIAYWVDNNQERVTPIRELRKPFSYGNENRDDVLLKDLKNHDMLTGETTQELKAFLTKSSSEYNPEDHIIKVKQKDEILPFNVIENGDERYYPKDGYVHLQKKVEDKDTGYITWVGSKKILACEPEYVRDIINKETEEIYYDLKAKSKGEEFHERFVDYNLLKSHLTLNYGVDINHTRAYLSLLRAKDEGKYTFIPDGISFVDEKYMFYKDEQSIIIEDINIRKVEEAKKQIKYHEEISNLKDKKMFRTLIRWMITAPFFFALKKDKFRKDEFIPYLIFNGEPETAKTSHVKIFTDINDEEVEGPDTIGSSFRLAEYFSSSKNFLAVDEAADILSPYNTKMNNTLKSNSHNVVFTARGNTELKMRKFLGKRTALFMTNDLYTFEPTFKRRCIVLTTTREDITTDYSINKFLELEEQGYSKNLPDLLTYLRLKIVERLNNKKISFKKAVDEVFEEEELLTYNDAYTVDDTRVITKEEVDDIYQISFSLIDGILNNKMSLRDFDEEISQDGKTEEVDDTRLKIYKMKLLENGGVKGIYQKYNKKEEKNKFYATSEFAKMFNKNAGLSKHISHNKLADAFNKELEQVWINGRNMKAFDISIIADYITQPGKEEYNEEE